MKVDPTVLGGRDAADWLGAIWVGEGTRGEVPLDTSCKVSIAFCWVIDKASGN